MKKINKLKSVIIIVVLFAFGLSFVGCEKEEDINVQKSAIHFDWNSLNWLSEASRNYYLDHYTEVGLVVESQQELNNYFNLIFNNYNFIYPLTSSISDNERKMYHTIVHIVSQYALSNSILRDYLNALKRDRQFINLDYHEKMRVAVFVKTIIGISEALEIINLEESLENSKQPPRPSYNSANGNSRFERQLNNCLSYQLDGHFETLAGSIVYIINLPMSFIWDNAICANEIYNGLWEHVK